MTPEQQKILLRQRDTPTTPKSINEWRAEKGLPPLVKLGRKIRRRKEDRCGV